ncbi:MAG: hypothetical protein JNM56_37120 [Planctomycetia bacterium]|nr:hypothetical protein [Planctomycetia bacterium]
MSLKLLVDMNLSPTWVPFLHGSGWSAVHGSAVGDEGCNESDESRHHSLDAGPVF